MLLIFGCVFRLRPRTPSNVIQKLIISGLKQSALHTFFFLFSEFELKPKKCLKLTIILHHHLIWVHWNSIISSGSSVCVVHCRLIDNDFEKFEIINASNGKKNIFVYQPYTCWMRVRFQRMQFFHNISAMTQLCRLYKIASAVWLYFEMFFIVFFIYAYCSRCRHRCLEFEVQ